MLRVLLQELEKAKAPMTLRELGRRMGVDESALEGMIAHLARKGRLADDAAPPRHLDAPRGAGAHDVAPGSPPGAGPGACASCAGAKGCPFVARIPRTIALRLAEDAPQNLSGGRCSTYVDPDLSAPT